MCGYFFLSLLIVTHGKSIFCALFVFLYLYVGIKVLVCVQEGGGICSHFTITTPICIIQFDQNP